MGQTCALLSVSKATQVACQQWSGHFCFAAGFRRPLFAVLEQIFSFIVEMEDPQMPAAELPNAVRDEILLAGLLMPLASTNLRAPLRQRISISDASEFGGAAAEATHFVSAMNGYVEKLTCNLEMNALEEKLVQVSQSPLECPIGGVREEATPISEASSSLPPTRATGTTLMPRSSLCRSCKTEASIARYRCPLGCAERLCSAQCYLKHRKSCSHAVLDRLKVLIASPTEEDALVIEMMKNGISVEVETPGRRRTPEAALLLVLTRRQPDRCREKERAMFQQLDALSPKNGRAASYPLGRARLNNLKPESSKRSKKKH